ncbi:MAG TPA: hypothetical protein VH561_00835 [Micromonosporaceae bacterium]|jgi:hypothetical protein
MPYLRGRLDPEGAAVLQSAIDALMRHTDQLRRTQHRATPRRTTDPAHATHPPWPGLADHSAVAALDALR